jgi:hypothetical protein
MEICGFARAPRLEVQAGGGEAARLGAPAAAVRARPPEQREMAAPRRLEREGC